MWSYNYSDNLYHHGVLGMRWGVRRFQNKNGQLTKSDNEEYNENKSTSSKKGLSDNQKKAIKIGAAVIGTALVSYGTYRLVKSGKLDKYVDKGKKRIDNLLTKNKVGNADIPKDTVKQAASRLKKLTKPETISDTVKNANPLRGTTEGTNNCVFSSIAGVLRQQGYDVTAKGTGGKMQNTAGVIENIFKNADIKEGSAVKFGRSKQDAAEMIKKNWGDNAKGVCSIDWTAGGGHCFNWKVQNGNVEFFDSQSGRTNVDNYFKRIKKDGQLVLARLDKGKNGERLEVNVDELSKIVNINNR